MIGVSKIKVGDLGPKLSFTVANQDGVPFNLTDATVTLKMTGGNSYHKIERACVIDDALGGKCHYILKAEDTVIPGKYQIELTLEYLNSKFTTVTSAELHILDSL